MKIPRCGGLRPAKRQVEILRDAGLLFLGSGLTDPGISLAATLILYGTFGYDRPAALNGPQFIDESILEDPFQPEEGVLAVPEGPGLGIEVNESKIDDLRVSLK
jgi:L-alanine-DL-glutamate epimerase-like enolase superfamily enzyme